VNLDPAWATSRVSFLARSVVSFRVKVLTLYLVVSFFVYDAKNIYGTRLCLNRTLSNFQLRECALKDYG